MFHMTSDWPACTKTNISGPPRWRRGSELVVDPLVNSGVKSRCPPYPHDCYKTQLLWDGFLWITVKRLAPCRIWNRHLKEPYEMSMALRARPLVQLLQSACTSSSLAKVPIRISPLPLGGFRQVSKTTALTPSGIRELSFLTSIL